MVLRQVLRLTSLQVQRQVGSRAKHIVLDNGDGSLTTDDAAIRFDFSLNESKDKSTNWIKRCSC